MTQKPLSKFSCPQVSNLTLPYDYVAYLQFPLTEKHRSYSERILKAYCLVDNNRSTNPIKKIRGELRIFLLSRDGSRFNPYYQHANYLISFQPSELKRIVQYVRGAADGNSEDNELSLHTVYDDDDDGKCEPILHLMQCIAGFGNERAATTRNFYLNQQEAAALAQQYDASEHDSLAQSALNSCEQAIGDPRSQRTAVAELKTSALQLVSEDEDLSKFNDNALSISQDTSPTLLKADEHLVVFTEPPSSPEGSTACSKKKRTLVVDTSDDDEARIAVGPTKRACMRKKFSQRPQRRKPASQMPEN